MNRSKLLAPVLLLCMLLQGCADSTGLLLAGIAVSEPFMRPTGDICVDRPAEAYASSGMTRCTASPLRPGNVNSRWRSSNGYCALEWALVFDRSDIVEEAIAKGADPFKCESRGFPLFSALGEVKEKYGADRERYYLQRLKDTKVVDARSAGKFVRFGIETRAVDFMQFGLDFGHPIDGPMNVNYQVDKFPDSYVGKSALYVASRKFLQSPLPLFAPPVEFLVRRGARIDPELSAYIAENRSQLKPGAVEKLQQLLHPARSGSL